MTKEPFGGRRIGAPGGATFAVSATPAPYRLPDVTLSFTLPASFHLPDAVQVTSTTTTWLTVEQAVELRDALDAAVQALTEQEETL